MSNQENQNKNSICSDVETFLVLNGKDIRDDMWVKVKYLEEIFFAQSFICGIQPNTILIP